VVDLEPSSDAATTRDFTNEVEALYRTDGARLWRAIYAYSASRSVTDDAVAEAFAQLLRRGADVRDVKAWVWRTAFRVAAGDLQRQRQAVNELVIDIAVDAPDDTIDLVAALGQLSEMQRKSLLLHDYAGHRAAEVAALTGSTEAAVRVHLMRGRRRLRTLLS
jgi:RNA polymerase sigma-70 factor, ECF subfamily